MNKEKAKFEFVSNEWVGQAKMILEDLVSQFGVEGVSFSVCETFTNAPTNIDPSGVASWHFYINGNSSKAAKGKVEDTDVKINFDYQEALVFAKIIYTEEIIAKQKKDLALVKKNLEKKGKVVKEPPEYLSELHNRLALLTS